RWEITPEAVFGRGGVDARNQIMLRYILDEVVRSRAGLLTSAALLSGGLFSGCDVDVHESPAPTVDHDPDRDGRGIGIRTPNAKVDIDRDAAGRRDIEVKVD
ncbi:MAG: hypothetical protein J0M17_22785, partial [Planctomycetes bacterium]|nr:hypothetical protein [Planctomycetota bacterium]